MFKKVLFLGLMMILTTDVFALNLTRVKTWSSGDILTETDLNAEFDNILNHSISNADIASDAAIPGSKLNLAVPGAIGGTTPAAGAFTTLSSTGDTTIGNAAADSLTINANTIAFEGATADDYETTLTITDPTADRVLTIPNASSVTLPSGAVFFMITGACPAGTTDVSATYSNKFIKVNATAGTASGAVLTGTSDSHVLGITEIPAHHHAISSDNAGAGGGSDARPVGTGYSVNTGDTGGGLGHTHTFSAATTLEPSSVTCILCQVN